MLYDEFIDNTEEGIREREETPYDYALEYKWEDISLPPDVAVRVQLTGSYSLPVHKKDVLAISKFVLVHKNKMAPETADKYIKENPEKAISESAMYIREAYESLAHDYMEDKAADVIDTCAAIKCRCTDNLPDTEFDGKSINRYILDNYIELRERCENENYYDAYTREQLDEAIKTFDEFKDVKISYRRPCCEYIDYDDPKRFDETFSLEYDWEDMGIPDIRAEACGFNTNHPYNFDVSENDVKAIIKHFLIRDEDQPLDDKLDGYIDDNLSELENDYDDEICRLFYDDALKEMRKVTETRIDLEGGEESFIDNKGTEWVLCGDTYYPGQDSLGLTSKDEILAWRPDERRVNDFMPREVENTRLSFLSAADRKLVIDGIYGENADTNFKARFFGVPTNDAKTPEWMQTAQECVKIAPDAKTAMKIFEASAAYDKVRDTNGMIPVVKSDGAAGAYSMKKEYETYINKLSALNKATERSYETAVKASPAFKDEPTLGKEKTK